MVVFDIFSKSGGTVPSKNKTKQISKDSFEKLFFPQKQQKLFETDDSKKIVKHFSTISWKGKRLKEILDIAQKEQLS